MPTLTVVYGEEIKSVTAPEGSVLGEVIPATGLPLEQPCAGRGTCGKCKVLVEAGVAPPDEIERQHLTPGELALDNRLACRARLQGDARVVLSPIVVYSNKSFRACNRHKTTHGPLGLAIDLGSTTVAAFLTILEDGEVCVGGAALNQQTVFGADVISRLAAARNDPVNRERLQRLALASINQAVDALKLSERIRRRIDARDRGGQRGHAPPAGRPADRQPGGACPSSPGRARPSRTPPHLMGGIFPEGRACRCRP